MEKVHAETVTATHVDHNTPETSTHVCVEPTSPPSLTAFDSQIEAISNRDNSGLDDPDLFNACYDETVEDRVEDLMPVEDEE